MDINTTIKRLANRSYMEGKSGLISRWQKYYRGDYDYLHYRINTGIGETLRLKKKSLNMPKKIAEDFANYILNEKCQIVIPEEPQKTLDAFLEKEGFWSKANSLVEQSMALSIGAIVEGIDGMEINEDGELVNKGKIKVRYINATKVYPITVRDSKIVECAFAVENTDYTDLEIHLINEETGNYYVKIARVNNKTGNTIPLDNEGTEYVIFDTLSNIPLFQLFYPNIVNNININSRLPISVYANCLDNFDCLDEKYDDFYLEFKNGKRRIFVNSELWKIDAESGSVIKTFDRNDTVFYALNFPNDTSGKPLIETSAESLREQSYINAINSELNLISAKLGLGKNYYNFTVGDSAKTATEIIAVNSELIKTMRKHELVIKEALVGFVKAIQHLSNTFVNPMFMKPLGSFKEEEIKIVFDDSAFEDKETEQTRDRTNVTSGLMSEVEYRMRWFGQSYEDAQLYVFNNLRYKLINNNLQALTSGAMTPEEFVNICYGDKDEATKEQIIEYINNKFNSNDVIEPNFDETF